jgi:glucose-1-phosphate adenylyltransferase
LWLTGAQQSGTRRRGIGRSAGDGGLEGRGTALLPGLAADSAARAYPLDGYWRDVGTVRAYWQAHRDFLAGDPPLDLDDPAWLVFARRQAKRPDPAQRRGDRQPDLRLDRVAGAVHGSVLSPGVVVEAGATVTGSVLLPGTRVAAAQ